jgi:hypothetical protein
MTGDVVMAKSTARAVRARTFVHRRDHRSARTGNNRFVGTLMRHPEAWLVQPDGSTFVEADCGGGRDGQGGEKDKVVVELLSYPSEKYLARGVIKVPGGRAVRDRDRVHRPSVSPAGGI